MIPIHNLFTNHFLLMNLITFDIDGTLLSLKDPMEYVNSYMSAFTAQFPKPDNFREFLPNKIAGLTDLSLIKFSINKATNNHANEQNIQKFCDDFAHFFSTNFQKGTIIARGLIEFLDELKQRNAVLGICSGNLPKIGEMKLQNCNILDYFDKDLRGFCWSSERNEMIKMIIEKAKEKYNIINVIHIGDTLNDVEASKEAGAIPVIITQFGLDDSVMCENSYEDFEKGKDKILSLLK